MTSSASLSVGVATLLFNACTVATLPPPIESARVADTFREEATVSWTPVQIAAMQCADVANAASSAASAHRSRRQLRASIGGAAAVALTAASASMGVYAFRDDAKTGTEAAFAATTTLAVSAIIYAVANWAGSESEFIDSQSRAVGSLIKARDQKTEPKKLTLLDACLSQR